MDKFKQYQYYIIVGVVSLFSVFFLPFLGSELGLGWVLPTTVAGWVVYITSKVLVAVINMLIFYCFMQQGKSNIKDNKKYVEACEIMAKTSDKKYIPLSPAAWGLRQYGFKGTTVAITTMLSAIGLTQAILVFDYVVMFSYIFTICMGVVFGIIQMNTAEEYWTDEYWRYAKMVEEQRIAEQEQQLKAEKEEAKKETIAYDNN